MNTDIKKEYIEQYIRNLATNLNNSYQGIIDNDKLSRAIDMFTTPDYLNKLNDNSPEELKNSFEQTIKPEIDKIVKSMIENYLKMINQAETQEKKEI